MKDFARNKIILAVLTVQMLGCFLDQNVNAVVSRFTSLMSFFLLMFVLVTTLMPQDGWSLKGLYLGGFVHRGMWLVGFGCFIALVNLFILHSNKGAFLTAADVLMAAYLMGRLELSRGERFYFGCLGSAFLLWWYCTVRWYFNFNMTGMIFMLTALMAMLMMEMLKERGDFPYLGFVQVITYVTATMLCLLYHARCVLAGMIVGGVLYLILPFILKRGALRHALVFAATFGSILFTLFYMSMDALGLNITVLYKEVLSGRQYIWRELWEALLSMPLTGIGSSYHLKSFFIFEVHNGLFDILAVHGVLVFACVVALLYGRLLRTLERADGSVYSRLCLAGAFAMLFTSFFENFFINSPYLLILLILICSVEKKTGV